MHGHARHRHALEDVVVDLLVMGLGRDGAAGLGIPHHDVGVGADADRALARVDVEDLRGVGRGDPHELVGRQPAGSHAIVPEDRHAIFHAAGAVGDLGEVGAAHRLLRRAKAAVVGCRGLQIARLQAAPQDFLVLLGPERRAHHVRRRHVPVGIAIDRIIDHEVAGQHLAEHALALVARARDGLERFAAGIVHDVERHAEHLGDPDGAIGSLALDLGRPRQRMALGAGYAGFQELLLQMEHQLAILGVDGADRAKLAGAGEAVHQHLVIRHDRALVGHEVLEAVDTVLLGERAHVAMDAVIPPGDRNVEGIVASRLLRPAPPLFVSLEQRLLRIGDHEVDDHGGAAGEARRRAGEEILRRGRAHEGQFHVGVRIDAARHDELAAGIDHARARRSVDARRDLLDETLVAENVRPVALIGAHHGAAADQRCHAYPPNLTN